MQVIRKQKLEVGNFIVGDQIQVGKYTATCQKITDGKAIFLLDQYLDKAYQMNRENTNKGGYEKSDLRATLKTATIDDNFINVKDQIIPFENGDLLRIATVGEMFGPNKDYESDYDKQWELMKNRKNRIAIRENEPYEWGWLQNTVKGSSAYFAYVGYDGIADYYDASDSRGVRPVFQLAAEKSGDLVSHHSRRYPWGSLGENRESLISQINELRSELKTLENRQRYDKETSELKELMDSYIRVGFTDDQAFQIILTAVEANIKK